MRWWLWISALALATGCSGKTGREPLPTSVGGQAAQSGQEGRAGHGDGGTAGGAEGVCATYLFSDGDGDGVGVAPYAKQLDTCTRQAPAGFALRGGDCDDADPARWQSAALDADADGFVESATVACLGELPTGYITRFDSDCNDADGAVWKIYHRDADGDGFGADGLDSEICAGAGAPNGYVALKPDCDDGDALRNHLAADQWGDGVDSDCNGDDDPFACSSDGFECPCSAFDVPPTLGELSCDDAPDLGLILLQRCLLCGPETVLVRVVNTGAQLSGPIRISVQLTPTTDGRSTDIPPPPIALPPLAPGEQTGPILLPPVWPIAVARVSSDGDCSLSNDELVLDSSYAECFR